MHRPTIIHARGPIVNLQTPSRFRGRRWWVVVPHYPIRNPRRLGRRLPFQQRSLRTRWGRCRRVLTTGMTLLPSWTVCPCPAIPFPRHSSPSHYSPRASSPRSPTMRHRRTESLQQNCPPPRRARYYRAMALSYPLSNQKDIKTPPRRDSRRGLYPSRHLAVRISCVC